MSDVEKLPPGGQSALPIQERIRLLVKDQLYGVLCTQSDGQPYGSMVAFAFTDDLRHAVFGTPKATKKYEILMACRNVALVVNNMNRHPNDLMKVEALTATGRANEITPTEPVTRWANMLAQRHPNLEVFVSSPSTALFEVEVTRFLFVCSFQEVTQWEPFPDGIR